MARCSLCGTASSQISGELRVCLRCIRSRPEESLEIAMTAHKRSRAAYGLPEEIPRDPEGLKCSICANECRIPPGGMGYCGLRMNVDGELVGVTPTQGKLSWYHDPLPTNCVADWVCAGGTGAGYPKYAHSNGPEIGYRNLAVFFHACTFNCLYCQNWQFRAETLRPWMTDVSELVESVDDRTSCICYFGGDPAPQLPFALKASRMALDARSDILRICWETNGSMNRHLLDEMLELSLSSGGCIKFDIKAMDENLHRALTGVSNRRTLENISAAAERIEEREEPPLVIASTLLVPGYIDENEVGAIADFLASLNPRIPYTLLAFHPQFHMRDMPFTSRSLAMRCLDAARGAGLERVRVGNIHILTPG